MKVPEVLTNGNHKLIEEWQLKESLRKNLSAPSRFIGTARNDATNAQILRRNQTRRKRIADIAGKK